MKKNKLLYLIVKKSLTIKKETIIELEKELSRKEEENPNYRFRLNIDTSKIKQKSISLQEAERIVIIYKKDFILNKKNNLSLSINVIINDTSRDEIFRKSIIHLMGKFPFLLADCKFNNGIGGKISEKKLFPKKVASRCSP